MNKKLLPNLKHSLTHNIGLKLLALLFSVALWFIVNNLNDPTIKKQFTNMRVEIQNADEITNLGKTYDILNDSDTVTVYVYGRKSVVDNLSRDDIKVYADMKNLTMLDTVSIQAYSVRNNSELEFTCSSETVQLSIEDIKSIQMVINTSTTGKPAAGYVVGTVTPSQNIVRISGPESIISQIDHVNAVAEIASAYTSDVNTSVELKIYNDSGNEIKSSSIKMNISTINVAVTILATKEVPVNLDIKGKPAKGYMLSRENTTEPQSILLAGRKTALDNINEISISDDSLSIQDATSSVNSTVNIKKHLPTGVQFADSKYNGAVVVTVGILPTETKELVIPKNNFAVDNVPEKFDYEIREFDHQNEYTVTIEGMVKDLRGVRASDVIGVVDMNLLAKDMGIEEWTAGVYAGDIIFNLPDTVELLQKHKFTIVLKEKEDEEKEE